jgi:hypothetical protein
MNVADAIQITFGLAQEQQRGRRLTLGPILKDGLNGNIYQTKSWRFGVPRPSEAK